MYRCALPKGPVRSAARGNPAAKSIRFALRTSSIVATSSANFSRCVLRWLGSRRLRSALMLSAIRVMPSTTHVLGPLKAKSLNHTPTPAVNPDLSETDGCQGRDVFGTSIDAALSIFRQRIAKFEDRMIKPLSLMAEVILGNDFEWANNATRL